MKTYQYILAAAALVLGFASCSEDALVQGPQTEQPSVEVTIGANFATTRTTMGADGSVLWSEGDQIKVQIGENAYDFDLASGKGTTSATFRAIVTPADAAILAGTAEGTVIAYYPTSGAAVPATQTYAEGTFADGMNPMTATYANSTLTFTNNAAVVRVQGVSATATSAVLSYTVNSTNYSVSMALTAGSAAKDLYFVVVPGAQDFNLALDGGADKYSASAVTEAGSRYNLVKYVEAKIGDVEYGTVAAAFAAVQASQTVKIMRNATISSKITVNKNCTLDMNGETLTASQKPAFEITEGTFTVIGDGTINNAAPESWSDDYLFHVKSSGKLVIGAESQNYDLNINYNITSLTETTIWCGKIEKVECFDMGGDSKIYINGGAIKDFDNGGLSFGGTCTIYLNGGIYGKNSSTLSGTFVIKSGYEIGENTDEATKTDYPWALVESVATASTETELKNAISNATAGDKIKLTANITLTDYLEISKNITIDLNGKELNTGSLTGNQGSGYRPIRIGAEVIIKNGTISGPNIEWGNGLINVMGNGNLTTTDLEMETPGICISARESSAVANITSGTYKSTGTVSVVNNYCYCTPLAAMNLGTINVSGGTFTGKYYAGSIFTSGGTINISGGTFNKGTEQTATNEGGGLAYAFLNDGANSATGTITITGTPTIHGSFRGRVNNQAGHPDVLNISGGTFDSDCELFNFNSDKVHLTGYIITANGECPDKGYSKTTGNGKRWKLTKNN